MRSLYKILHTVCQTGWGGIEKRILNESIWMADKGHQVILAAPENTPLFERAKGYGFRLYPMTFTRLGTLSNYRSLIRIFENEQPHILNTHGHADAKIALPAAMKAHVPCRILSRHIGDPLQNSWSGRRLYKKLSDYIFTTTSHTRRHVQTVFSLKEMKIFSIPPGIVEPEPLSGREEARKTLAAQLGLDESTRFIGVLDMGTAGLPPLYRAFKKIRPSLAHHLVILGPGNEKNTDRLKEACRNLDIEDRVHFPDMGDHAWFLFRAMDCQILAALDERHLPEEDTAQALFQAMYCSCPVIGPKIGVAADIIEPGKTGLLHEPGQENRIAECLLATLNQEAATLERVHAAREQVKKHHTMDAVGRDITRIFRLHQVRLEKDRLP